MKQTTFICIAILSALFPGCKKSVEPAGEAATEVKTEVPVTTELTRRDIVDAIAGTPVPSVIIPRIDYSKFDNGQSANRVVDKSGSTGAFELTPLIPTTPIRIKEGGRTKEGGATKEGGFASLGYYPESSDAYCNEDDYLDYLTYDIYSDYSAYYTDDYLCDDYFFYDTYSSYDDVDSYYFPYDWEQPDPIRPQFANAIRTSERSSSTDLPTKDMDPKNLIAQERERQETETRRNQDAENLRQQQEAQESANRERQAAESRGRR